MDVPFSFSSGAQALVAATPKTCYQFQASANVRDRIDRIRVTFDGVSPTAVPVNVKVMTQTTAGTGSSASNPVKVNPNDPETLQCTGIKGCATEPASGNLIEEFDVHPQFGDEVLVDCPVYGGVRVGIVCTAPAGVNVIVAGRGRE